MGTRRDFVRQGSWAAAAPWVPAGAQGRPEAATGTAPALSPEVERTLMACAEAITGVQPLRGHYADYWRYQATQRPGRAELYMRFAATVGAGARSAGIADFAAADLRARAAVIGGLRSLPDFEREFEVPVFQEIIALFERTDAWIQLGYASWPGSPRGLDEYRRAPASLVPR